ncbi:hypothetical protein ABZ702_23260 [Streptomyces cyaneofuscatus]|uniref:hypothetical protein n=1 Tax=Streptomyces cyaneofuscatus TaxID=66883 RepID=UPI00340706F4
MPGGDAQQLDGEVDGRGAGEGDLGEVPEERVPHGEVTGVATVEEGRPVVAGVEAVGRTAKPPPHRPAATRDTSRHLPALVLAFTVHKPGHDPAGNAITALKDMRRRNCPTNWLAADRAYNAALPETFHIPVRDLGYRPIWDYRIDQLGIQGSHAGALLLSFQIAHANHRKLTSWLDTLQTGGLPARRPSDRHKLKNPHDRTPGGYPPGPTSGN